MERYKVGLTDSAKTDIRVAARYIAVNLREPDTAERLLDRFDEALAELETMPMSHACVHDAFLASRGVRMTQAGNYLLFYLAISETLTVKVLRVLYGRRDWFSILTADFEEER